MTKISPLNVMVLSNQLLYLEALKSLLNSESTLSCKGLLMSNPEANRIIKAESPELLLIDANSMGKSVWDFLSKAKTWNPSIKTIILANTNEPTYLDQAKNNGASGYILNSSPRELLMATIQIVKNGSQFFDTGNYSKFPQESFQEKYNLSKREMEVINLINDAKTTKTIAEELGLSFHTIEAHRKNIYKKLRIKKVTELTKLLSDFE